MSTSRGGPAVRTRAPRLSIVIPAFNERARLPRTLVETLQWCDAHAHDSEVIVVDDGSTDETRKVVSTFEAQDHRVRCLPGLHKGKGAAVRAGMLQAKGNTALFMDADGATPLTEIPKLLRLIEGGADVAIGSRVLPATGARQVDRSLHRRVLAGCFSGMVSLLAVRGFSDTQCGFKMFRHEAIESIFTLQHLDGFAFDVEILFIARRLRLRIDEAPINWTAQPGSKINLVTDSLRMLWDLASLRWSHRHDAPRVVLARAGAGSNA